MSDLRVGWLKIKVLNVNILCADRDEGGAQHEEFRRETVYRLQGVLQTNHFAKDVFDLFLQSFNL